MRRLDWAENCGGGTALLQIACSEQVNDEMENMGRHATREVGIMNQVRNNIEKNNVVGLM